MALYIILIIITGIIGFCMPRSKFLPIIMLVVMGYIFAFNKDNNDFDAYYQFYNSCSSVTDFINDSSSSLFFTYSVLVAKNIGLDFFQYRLIVFLIIVILLFQQLKNKVSGGVLLLSYGLIIFFFDLVQIRFAISQFLLLLGFFKLAEGRRNLFLLYLICATFFHSMNVVFAIFYFVDILRKYYSFFEKYTYYILLAILTTSVISAPIISAIQATVAMIPQFAEYEHYMEQEVRYGFLLYVVYQIMAVLLAKSSIKTLKYQTHAFTYRLLQNNFLIQIIGLLFVYPAMLNINFSRFMREFYIFNMICFAIVIFLNNKRYIISRKNYQKALLYYFVTFFLWILGETIVNGSYNTITTLVFKSL